MNAKRTIGYILLLGAVVALANKFVGGMSGNLDQGLGFYFIGLAGLLLFLAIRRVLRS